MYRKIFNSMSESIMVCKIEKLKKYKGNKFICINVNDSFLKNFKLQKEAILGENIFNLENFLDEEILKNYISKLLKNKRFRKTLYIEHLKKYYDVELALHKDDEFFIKFTDITNIKEMKFLIGKYEFLFENARDVILFIDMNGNIINANNRAVELYGYTKDEFYKMKIFDLRFDTEEFVYNQMDEANEKGILFESEHKAKNGEKIPVEISSIGTNISGQRVLLSIIRDITIRKKDREKIKKLAYYDTLTKLPNRRFFIEELANMIHYHDEHKNRISIMFLDIDGFKLVNDHYGHSIGDLLLYSIGRRLQNTLRNDDIVARLGGDEFVILNYNINDLDTIKRIANRINYVLRHPFVIKNNEIKVSASIGISIYPDDANCSEELMKKADKTMYKVKALGGNSNLFYKE